MGSKLPRDPEALILEARDMLKQMLIFNIQFSKGITERLEEAERIVRCDRIELEHIVNRKKEQENG